MRILVDLQGAQTESRFHGIGRYSLEISLALARSPRDHEIWLLLNGAFDDSVRELRRAFADLVPAERADSVAPSRDRARVPDFLRVAPTPAFSPTAAFGRSSPTRARKSVDRPG